MKIVRCELGQDAASLLRGKKGHMILLNVRVQGSDTSVCVFIKGPASASWRRSEKCKNFSLDVTQPGFAATNRTVMLDFNAVNVLSNNFQTIREIIPIAAINVDGRVAVGKLEQDSDDMGTLLSGLERRTDAITTIERAIEVPLNTPVFLLRQQKGQKEVLVVNNGLSEYGNELLAAFEQSQGIYSQLPELRTFGTENERLTTCPSQDGALLRDYMKQAPQNPLGTTRPIGFVDYELKPLHMSDGLTWDCTGDRRTDSIDLLLVLEGSPVLTEVKMKKDSFASTAAVQLLYYASTMANEMQARRLRREFPGKFPHFADHCGWLGIIVENRVHPGFVEDVHSTAAFFQHESTRRTLAPFYRGAVLLVIEKHDEPFCVQRGIPPFQAIPEQQYFIDWA